MKMNAKYFIILILIPALIAAGRMLLAKGQYTIISMAIAIVSCAVFFIKYEKKRVSTVEMVIVAVMTAVSATSRIVFSLLPHIKPVSAITIITAIHLGPEAGFVTGAMSAVVSNMFFGQGPWTPFQMFAWGLCGFLAGILAKARLLKNNIVLSVFGAVAGMLFSLMMDVWTVLAIDGTFNMARYISVVIMSGGVMIEYAASNVLFLLLLNKSLGDKLIRIKIKYLP